MNKAILMSIVLGLFAIPALAGEQDYTQLMQDGTVVRGELVKTCVRVPTLTCARGYKTARDRLGCYHCVKFVGPQNEIETDTSP